MFILIPCPQCANRFRLNDSSGYSSGKLIRCPSCSHAFIVKAADEPEAASEAEAVVSPTPPARPLTGASVDRAALRKLAASSEGAGSGLVARVVKTYLFTSQKLLSAICDAAEAGDVKALVGAAHAFKSSSAHFGALRLSSFCEDLESLCRGGSCEGAREFVDRIVEEFASVQRELPAEDISDPASAAGPVPAESERPNPPPVASERRQSSRPEGQLPPVNRERWRAPAAQPSAPTERVVRIGRVALRPPRVATGDVDLDERSRDVDLDERARAEPRWRRLIRDSHGVMRWAIDGSMRWASRSVKRWAAGGVKRWTTGGVKRWAIGGGVVLVALALVNLLWLGPAEPGPEPRLAAPSRAPAADGRVPAPRPAVSKPGAMAERAASTAAPAATAATAPRLITSLPHTATPAPVPEVAAKPAKAVQPRRATTPRAAKPPTRARATRTPKTKPKSTSSSVSRKRTKAVSKQTKPRTKRGSRTVKKEPSTRSRSKEKEAPEGWTIEH